MNLAWRDDDSRREPRNRSTGRNPDICLDGGVADDRWTGIGNRLVGEDGEARCGTEVDFLRLGIARQSDAHKAKSCGTNE